MRAIFLPLASAMLLAACGAGSGDGSSGGQAAANGGGDYPPAVQAARDAGLEIVSEFQAPGGLTAYAARGTGGQRMILYLAPDGEHLIVGNMIDAKGNNLTSGQLAEHLPRPRGEDAWARLEKANWVAEGPEDPKRVIYSFTDPNCPYCNKLWKTTSQYHDAGLQVRHILVGMLKPSSMGKAAAILQAEDPSAALDRHERNFSQGGIEALDEPSAETMQKIRSNNRLMQDLGIRGTPAVYYRDGEGEVRSVNGVPPRSRLPEIIRLSKDGG